MKPYFPLSTNVRINLQNDVIQIVSDIGRIAKPSETNPLEYFQANRVVWQVIIQLNRWTEH